MQESLLGKKTKTPSYENVVVVIIFFIALILSAVAFYIAVNNYLLDRTDKTRIEGQQNRLKSIYWENGESQRIIQSLNYKESQLDDLNTQCNTLKTRLAQDYAQVQSISTTTFVLYDSLNLTITNEQVFCDRELLNLTTVLQYMLDPLTKNASIIHSGTCQWNSLVVNGTITVPFTYNLLNVNGLDFYFYSFGNSTDAVDASYGARIEKCSPVLFRGTQQNIGPYQRYLDGFTGSPLSVSSYLKYIKVGSEYLELVPKSIPSVNQTMGIQGFNLWLGLF
jgi:hypothetical protein